MAKHKIVELQERYIETNDESILNELYTNLLKMGFHCLKNKNYFSDTGHEMEVVVYDVVHSIIERLFTKKEVVIKTGPYRYIQRAIFFATYPPYKKVYQLSEEHYELDEEMSAEDSYFESRRECDLKERIEQIIIENTLDLDEEDQDYLKEKVFECLSSNKHYSKFIYKVKRRHQKRFEGTLLLIKEMLMRNIK